VRLARRDVRDHIKYSKNRMLAFVAILPSLAAAEIANMHHLQDFRSTRDFRVFQHNRRKAVESEQY
jgi:hypothetical protein